MSHAKQVSSTDKKRDSEIRNLKRTIRSDDLDPSKKHEPQTKVLRPEQISRYDLCEGVMTVDYIRHGTIDDTWIKNSMNAMKISELRPIVVERAWPHVMEKWDDRSGIVVCAFKNAFMQGLQEPTPLIMKIVFSKNEQDYLFGFINTANCLHSTLLSEPGLISIFPQTTAGMNRWVDVFGTDYIVGEYLGRKASEIERGMICFYEKLPSSDLIVNIPPGPTEYLWMSGSKLYRMSSSTWNARLSSSPWNGRMSSSPWGGRISSSTWNTDISSERLADPATGFILAADFDRKEDLECVNEKVCMTWTYDTFLKLYLELFRQIPSTHSKRIATVYNWTRKNTNSQRPISIPFEKGYRLGLLPTIAIHHPHLWVRLLVDAHRVVPLFEIPDVDISAWPPEVALAATSCDDAFFGISDNSDGALGAWWRNIKCQIETMCMEPVKIATRHVNVLTRIVFSFLL